MRLSIGSTKISGDTILIQIQINQRQKLSIAVMRKVMRKQMKMHGKRRKRVCVTPRTLKKQMMQMFIYTEKDIQYIKLSGTLKEYKSLDTV